MEKQYHSREHALRSTVRFALRRDRRDNKRPAAIYARFRVFGDELAIPTGVTARPDEWDNKRRRIKPSSLHAVERNDLLARVERRILEAVLSLQREEAQITKVSLRDRYESLRVQHIATKRTFFDLFDTWREECRETKERRTVLGYGTTREHLSKYATRRGITLSLGAITPEFVKAWVNDMLRVDQLQNPTIWKDVKNLKVFMGWAVEKNYTDNRSLDTVTSKMVPTHKGVGVRLTEADLEALATVDLSDDPKVDNARNLFVLQSVIGMRFSDLTRIAEHPAQYRHGNQLLIRTKKVKKPVMIPLLPVALRILERTDAVRPISNQKMNAYIKIAAKRAGLTNPVVLEETRGIEIIEKVVPKWEAVTTHVAKRTFMSLAIAKGVSVEVVMAITGNTRATVDRYITLTEEEVETGLKSKLGGMLISAGGKQE